MLSSLLSYLCFSLCDACVKVQYTINHQRDNIALIICADALNNLMNLPRLEMVVLMVKQKLAYHLW